MHSVVVKYKSGRLFGMDPVRDYSQEGFWLHVLFGDGDVTVLNLSDVELFSVTESKHVQE